MSLNSELLQQLMSHPNPESSAAMIEAVQSCGSLTPRSRILLQMLAETSQGQTTETEINTREQENSERLAAQLDYLESELEEAQEMIDVLAGAIGACSDCFGASRDCPQCLGEGRAGWKQPEPRLFRHFIVPAVLRVRKSRVRSNPNSKIPEGELDLTQKVSINTQPTKGEEHVEF